MRLIPASLSGRLFAGAVLLIAAALLATGIGMDLALRRFIEGQVDGRLEAQIASVRDALRVGPEGVPTLAHVVDGPPFDRPGSGWFWQVLAPGPVLRSASLAPLGFLPLPPPDFDRPPPLLHRGREPPRPPPFDGADPRGEPLRMRAVRIERGGLPMIIEAAAPRQALYGPLREAMIPLAVTLGLLAAVLVGGVALQVRLGLRPLAGLTAELARVRTGRADRIGGTQPHEIAPLVGELNTLLDQNAANLERARRHVANLAHGLKTPLATLTLGLAEGGRDPDGRLTALAAIMDRRIRHHLSRARLAALGGPERARTDLAVRVADHLAVFAKLYADKSLAFAVDIDPGVAVACETQDLDEIIGNLLDNACKWARGRVRIAADATSDASVMLLIEDDGPGLPDDRADTALQPGQRLDETMPGHGFGLPIALELAELYGGALRLRRAPLGGLQAAVTLPRAR